MPSEKDGKNQSGELRIEAPLCRPEIPLLEDVSDLSERDKRNAEKEQHAKEVLPGERPELTVEQAKPCGRKATCEAGDSQTGPQGAADGTEPYRLRRDCYGPDECNAAC